MGSKKKEAKKAAKNNLENYGKEQKRQLKEIKKLDKAEMIERLKTLSVPKTKAVNAELRRVFGKALKPELGGVGDRIWFDGMTKLKIKFPIHGIDRALLFSILQKLPSYSEII